MRLARSCHGSLSVRRERGASAGTKANAAMSDTKKAIKKEKINGRVNEDTSPDANNNGKIDTNTQRLPTIAGE
jgi:hypothetical protein